MCPQEKFHEENAGVFRVSRTLAIVDASYRKHAREVVERLGLNYSELPVTQALLSLESRGVPKASQTEIANMTMRDKALVTRSVRSLAEKGLVETHVDATNGSRNDVHLTDEGREIAKKANDAIFEWEERFLDSFEDQRGQAEAVFKKLNDFIGRL